jgi:hypothetical protein
MRIGLWPTLHKTTVLAIETLFRAQLFVTFHRIVRIIAGKGFRAAFEPCLLGERTASSSRFVMLWGQAAEEGAEWLARSDS